MNQEIILVRGKLSCLYKAVRMREKQLNLVNDSFCTRCLLYLTSTFVAAACLYYLGHIQTYWVNYFLYHAATLSLAHGYHLFFGNGVLLFVDQWAPLRRDLGELRMRIMEALDDNEPIRPHVVMELMDEWRILSRGMKHSQI